MAILLIPAAGDSKRFPGLRPKWMLTHPMGEVMGYAASKGVIGKFSRRILAIRDKVAEEFGTSAIKAAFRGEFEVVVVPHTNNQVETIRAAIIGAGVHHEPIFCKDSDNFFVHEFLGGNEIACADLADVGALNAANKSYIKLSDAGMAVDVQEKAIISSTFGVGGYGFQSARLFMEHSHSASYPSEVVMDAVRGGVNFKGVRVSGYSDWGTLEDWNAYKRSYATIFCDIDGVLFKNAGEFFGQKWGSAPAIAGNVAKIKSLYANGRTHIVLTTSRPESMRHETESELCAAGVRYHSMLMGLPHAMRVVINDFSRTNPYRSCESVNIERDSDLLAPLLEGVLK